MGHPSTVERSRTPYVVVGATGILAPLGALLAGDGARRIGVARGHTAIRGDWDVVVRRDTTDPAAIPAILAEAGSAYDLVGYLPALTPKTWMSLCENANHRVLLAPSRYADPATPDAIAPWLAPGGVTVCTLGCVAAASGARWHTPDEIAAAAQGALAAAPGSRVLLGRVRPWGQRPG
jgi:hypothetical protein